MTNSLQNIFVQSSWAPRNSSRPSQRGWIFLSTGNRNLWGGSEDAENGISQAFAPSRSAALAAGIAAVACVGFTWGNDISVANPGFSCNVT